MSIKDTIHSAGQNCHTVLITAKEKDGSIETRESEPYSYRMTAGTEKFFCYDIQKDGIRNLLVSNIISVEEQMSSSHLAGLLKFRKTKCEAQSNFSASGRQFKPQAVQTDDFSHI